MPKPPPSRPNAPTRPPAKPAIPANPSPPGRRTDVLIAAGLAAVAVAIYLNTIRGDFVYDDARQIVGNPLIQDGRYFGKALLSDVWAFKGSTGGRVSNYWRPSFILWLMANVRAFGLASTVGWHLGNIALHALTTVLGFALCRRLGMGAAVAGAIGLLFAVHPAHVETVAWISGSPDLILAPALIGSLWFLLNTLKRPTVLNWAAAILCYLIAQGAKEVAIFYGLIALLACRAASVKPPGDSRPDTPAASAWRPAAIRAAPFCILAVAYLIIRSIVLGGGPVAQGEEGAPSLLHQLSIDLLNAPQVGAFYLRQMLVPIWIGPSYPLRPVFASTISAGNFVLPLLVCIAAGVWMLREAIRHPLAALGLALFVLPLAPAMHITAFRPEQLVHDRYLYLPSLGFLLVFVPAIARIASVAGQARPLAPARAFVAAAAVWAVALGTQTVRYNTAWLSEVALWRWAVRSDPTSGFNANQLAVFLREAANKAQPRRDDLLQEARQEADRAAALIAASPDLLRTELANSLLIQADIALDQGRYADAERSLNRLLADSAANPRRFEVFQAYSRLSIVYERQRQMPQAESVLREGISRLPQHKAALTHLLAVVLVNSGRPDLALRELEAVRPAVAAEFTPTSRMVLFDLGRLYVDKGRRAEAAAALREFLDRTAGSRDPEILASRNLSSQFLPRLGG